MQIDFTAEQEARLSEIATCTGTDAEHLVREAALRLQQEDRSFCEGVARGIEAADRGQFVQPGEVWKGLETILEG
jgi:predicted transcriptional regulator